LNLGSTVWASWLVRPAAKQHRKWTRAGRNLKAGWGVGNSNCHLVRLVLHKRFVVLCWCQKGKMLNLRKGCRRSCCFSWKEGMVPESVC
jgi:hypothetical protein